MYAILLILMQTKKSNWLITINSLWVKKDRQRVEKTYHFYSSPNGEAGKKDIKSFNRLISWI